MWTDFGEHDPDFELVEEGTNYCVDLDNFPDPSNFMCLDYYNLETKEDFSDWWKENTDENITKFRSFSKESRLVPQSSDIIFLINKRCSEAGLRKLDKPDNLSTLFKLGIRKEDVTAFLINQNFKFPFECDNKYTSFFSSVELNDNNLYVISLYLSKNL